VASYRPAAPDRLNRELLNVLELLETNPSLGVPYDADGRLAHVLEVYRWESERWVLLGTHRGAVTVRAEPFDAVDVDLSALWIG
jgi:hypothetical protein